MKDKRTCSNCIKGTAITVNGDVLCREKGAVSPDYICSKHKYVPGFQYVKELCNKCIQCEYFMIELKAADGQPGIGLCKLFSVRQYDGTQKRACSKFIKKAEQEVS